MKTIINLEVSKIIQPSFWNMANSRARYLVTYGGGGAGKSHAVARKLILMALKYSNMKIIPIRKYGPALRLTCFSMLMSLIRKYQIPHKVNDTDMIISLGKESKIICMPIVNSSGEPAERLKSLTDVNVFWLEEPTELSYDEFQMIDLRLRGEDLNEGYRQMILSFNPIDVNHWLHKHFFESDPTTKQLREADKFKYTYLDNAFIDKEYKNVLEGLKSIDEVKYKVYALGEWGILAGQIYSRYVIEEFNHPLDYYDEVLAGCDFGFENPSAWVLIGFKEKTAYLIDEIYQSKLINPEFIQLIKRKEEEHNIKPEIQADYAEPARIEEMRREGLQVREANKNVQEGINFVKNFKLVIHPRCINISKEISGYKRKTDRNGNVLEEPVKFNDHSMDALRYGIMGHQHPGGYQLIGGIGRR